ncbi:MAG: hypothetical protein GY862_19085 [Gammaproteobacteria bacterium]|nr:hypothetical protein [Gammaproteobacteria bacterium]
MDKITDRWGQTAKLIAADGVEGELFGFSVSVNEDIIVVGAQGDDDNGNFSGSAYVFQRNRSGADMWDQVTKLTAADSAAEDRFGHFVSISGDTVMVEAYANDDNSTSSGSAYIFQIPFVMVDNADDSGTGSLRNAIAIASAGDTIFFDSAIAGQTIILASLLKIDKDLTIDGGAQNISISGDTNGDGTGDTRIFRLTAGSISLKNLTIRDGYAPDTEHGGGILVDAGVTLTVSGSAFLNNRADTNGGAVRVTDNTVTVTIDKSLFQNNSASHGGAISNEGVLTVNNSTFLQNSSLVSKGGGIRSQGSLEVNNSTFSGNSGVDSGGGISVWSPGATLALTNTILANNAGSGEDCYTTDQAVITLNLNNLIEDGSCNTGATGLVTGDPKLGSLQDNGGPVQTMALELGSPAIDAGDDAACLSEDQRGLVRPRDGDGDGTAACDIGAFELVPPLSVELSVSADTGSEADTSVINVTATTSAAVTDDQSLTLTVTGTGITSVDYSLSNPVITIPDGAASGSVAIMIIDDDLMEGTEIATLTLAAPSAGIVLGSVISQDITIIENDISTVNLAPELVPIGTQTVLLGNILTIDAKATDLNDDILQFSFEGVSGDAHINPDTGAFSWPPANAGTFMLTIRVADSDGLSDSEVFSITVTQPQTVILSEQIPLLDADQMSATAPEAFSAFSAEDTALLPDDVFSVITPEQLGAFTREGLNGLLPTQFQQLPVNALSGLTAANIGGLAAKVLQNLTPKHLLALKQALNQNEFRLVPGQDIAKVLTNLDAVANISTADVADLIPPGWTLASLTGKLTAPPNTRLAFRENPRPADLSDLVSLPKLPDLNTAFSLGGTVTDTSLLEDMDRSLAENDLSDFAFSQKETGILSLKGSAAFEGMMFAFMPDINKLLQAGADTPAGVSADKGGHYVVTTPDKLQFTLVPAPLDPAGLVNQLGSESAVKTGTRGDTLLKLPAENTGQRQASFIFESVIFDPFIESAPADICEEIAFGNIQCDWDGVPSAQAPGVHIFNAFSPFIRNAEEEQESRVVYENGSSQKVHATVLSPDTFIQKVFDYSAVTEAVYRADGRFDVFYQGQQYRLTPAFGVSMEPLGEGEPANLTVLNESTLEYTIKHESLLLRTTVSIFPELRATVFSPESFIAKGLEFEGVESLTLNPDGTFDVLVMGQKFRLVPTSDIQARELAEGEEAEPAVSVNEDGSLAYTVFNGLQVITTKVLVESVENF